MSSIRLASWINSYKINASYVFGLWVSNSLPCVCIITSKWIKSRHEKNQLQINHIVVIVELLTNLIKDANIYLFSKISTIFFWQTIMAIHELHIYHQWRNSNTSQPHMVHCSILQTSNCNHILISWYKHTKVWRTNRNDSKASTIAHIFSTHPSYQNYIVLAI
jgi:hypothetical protein